MTTNQASTRILWALLIALVICLAAASSGCSVQYKKDNAKTDRYHSFGTASDFHSTRNHSIPPDRKAHWIGRTGWYWMLGRDGL